MVKSSGHNHAGTSSNSPNKEMENALCTTPTSKDRKFQQSLNDSTSSSQRLWRILFHKVLRMIDELYCICEEEGDIDHCEQAFDLLLRGGRDFAKLIERLGYQRSQHLNHATSMSWEVRKPTTTVS
jgi:hypothetical protein